MNYPELCPTCNKPYDKLAMTFCSNPFHLCRDCVRRDGRIITRCSECQAEHDKQLTSPATTCENCGFRYFNTPTCPACQRYTTDHPVTRMDCFSCGEPFPPEVTKEQAHAANNAEYTPMEIQDADSGGICIICGGDAP